jgi:sortase family protein
MGPARLASRIGLSVAVLAAVTALGALAGFRLAGPGRPAAAVPTTADSLGPSAAATARAYPMAVTITVRDAGGRTLLRAPVGALDPVPTAGGFAPVDPPRWRQAVWVRYRPLVRPTDPARGTSYVYGHACHHHDCAFTALKDARRGGTVVVTGDGRQVVYRITSTSDDYPKSGPGSLAQQRNGVANRNVADRLVLITCAYDSGDVSLNNFVVVARRA